MNKSRFHLRWLGTSVSCVQERQEKTCRYRQQRIRVVRNDGRTGNIHESWRICWVYWGNNKRKLKSVNCLISFWSFHVTTKVAFTLITSLVANNAMISWKISLLKLIVTFIHPFDGEESNRKRCRHEFLFANNKHKVTTNKPFYRAHKSHSYLHDESTSIHYIKQSEKLHFSCLQKRNKIKLKLDSLPSEISVCFLSTFASIQS